MGAVSDQVKTNFPFTLVSLCMREMLPPFVNERGIRRDC